MSSDYADCCAQTSQEDAQKRRRIIGQTHACERPSRRPVIPLCRDHCENLPQNGVKQLQERTCRENFIKLGNRNLGRV